MAISTRVQYVYYAMYVFQNQVAMIVYVEFSIIMYTMKAPIYLF